MRRVFDGVVERKEELRKGLLLERYYAVDA